MHLLRLSTGIYHLTFGNIIMWLVAFILIYLAIKKKYEPLLLLPIGFGIFVVNLPLTHLMEAHGILGVFYHYGLEWEIIPPLIFLGLGAMTDFGPLIANPKTLLLGAAAQFGVYVAFFAALAMGFSIPEAFLYGHGADNPATDHPPAYHQKRTPYPHAAIEAGERQAKNYLSLDNLSADLSLCAGLGALDGHVYAREFFP